MVVYCPPWAKPGCTVIRTFEKDVVSGTARGLGYWVVYLDKKRKEQRMMKWVIWH